MTTAIVHRVNHKSLKWLLSDLWVLIVRSFKHIFRHMDQLLGVAFQPIMFMLLFRYVFGGAIETGTSYVNFLVPGILIQMAAFGATTTSYSVASDLQKGIIDRLKSLPIASYGVVAGHVVADLFRNILSSVILIGVGFIVGFRPEAGFTDWVLILALLLAFTFAFSWASAIMGLLAKSVEAVQWMGFIVIFPLTFASAAFVPTSTMPKYLRIFAENQPITQVIEAMRALMLGKDPGDHYWIALIWMAGITIVSIPIAAYLFRNHTSK
jgi:ABC-2 type transport system permease protein